MEDWRSAEGLLALMGLPGVGPAKAMSAANNPDEIDALDPDGRLPDSRRSARVKIDSYESAGVRALGFFDEAFPEKLRQIPQPPAVLYVRGKTEWPEKSLAVVGTRHPSDFGVSATYDLTRRAGEAGFSIVSGLALGVDTVAHKAALAVGTPTIAILGCGLDTVTPAQNRGLAHEILDAGGSVISEQPFGTAPSARTLVARNRLQSGLAQALLVGQTGIKGGTLHTVRFAALQGRPVYCPVPTSVAQESAGLDVLLNVAAQDLPNRLVAWRSYPRRSRSALGTEPLAKGVDTRQPKPWLEALLGLSAETPTGDSQLTLPL